MKALQRIGTWILVAIVAYAMYAWSDASAAEPSAEDKATSPLVQQATVIVRRGDVLVGTFVHCDIVAVPAAHDPSGMSGFLYDAEARMLRLEIDCDPVFRDGFE